MMRISSFTNNLTGWENVDPNTVTGAGLNGFDWCGISYSDVTDKFRGALQYINVSGHKNRCVQLWYVAQG